MNNGNVSKAAAPRPAKATAPRAAKASRTFDRTVQPVTGKIVRIMAGQGHGFIRLPNDRDVFFHRADMQEGTSLRDLHVGDRVAFDLLDDPVSGPRGLRVRRPEGSSARERA
jgi:cold shock CspA family protein